MNEEIKDAAITLLQTLMNATGAEPEDERLAIQIIAKTMQEVVNENNLLQRVSGCGFTEHEIQLIHFALLNFPEQKLSKRTNGYKHMQRLADKVLKLL